MSWVPVAAWCLAGALAVVVLGYGIVEVLGKLRRLRADLARLESVRAAADELHSDLDVTRQRLAAASDLQTT